ncbi:hypothetical protein C8R45DRAFT_1143036, partial [Mycena sanguinolenta]
MYRHKILRINFTSYDVRRGQDCLNPRTHSDVMTLAPEGDTTHPFSYAQIIGIFHADVVNTARGAEPKPQSMEFLWVRRYRLDSTWRAGFKKKRLFRLEFLPDTDPNAFGFLNPDEVIRGAHLIPAFAWGKTTDLLAAASVGRLPRSGLSNDEDWRYYYVNFFVDRDMYMRYLGGGVGHYRVEVPHDGDAEDEDAPAPAPDSDEDEFPRSIPLPQGIPPPSPEAAPAPLPDNQDEDLLDPGRPSSSLSQNSDDSEAAQSPAVSESDTDSDLDGNLDDDEDGYSDGEDELGPEDGDGAIEDEIEDGYSTL